MKNITPIIPKILGLLLLMSLMGIASPVDANVSASAPNTIKVIAGGVPKYWGETRDYDAWFSTLAAAGVTSFLPFSEYQEVPEALYLGYETDFMPPCSPDDPSFTALRTHHIQLVVAGDLLYSAGTPALEADPLRALMTCAGEGMIAGVLSIDEPAKFNPSENIHNAQALYERIKTIAPELPVMMVHAPIPDTITQADGKIIPTTQSAVDTYLNDVKNLSAYADIIGFDLYPIPTEITPFIAPNLGLSPVGYQKAFPAYMNWLRSTLADKSYMLALQAFSYQRLLSPQAASDASAAGYKLPFPTEAQLQDMACLTIEGGASQFAWWGQSALISEDQPFWDSVLATTKAITLDPVGYCKGRSLP